MAILLNLVLLNLVKNFITYNHMYYHVCEIILNYPNLTIIADRQLSDIHTSNMPSVGLRGS